MNYWLMKSEPSVYSLDDLEREESCFWEGIRNYQARNFIKDSFQTGDLAFFYHSNCTPPGIAGLIKIITSAYPDHTSWDPQSDYYDPKSSPEHPRWFMVDVIFEKRFPQYIPLSDLKIRTDLKGLKVREKGSRLSIQPVSETHFNLICRMGMQTE